MQVYRFDLSGRLGKFARTPSGGIRVPAYISRTGVLTYDDEDGSVKREYRPESEVLREESWRTFEGAPITVDHPPGGELVTPETWRELAIGYVTNVRPDGQRIAADLVIEDAEAIAAIERGELIEVSAGYRADLEPAPGIVDGQAYDAVQRQIIGNHVALGPEGWGRSGPSVSLRLDGRRVHAERPLSRLEQVRRDSAGLAPSFAYTVPETTSGFAFERSSGFAFERSGGR